MGLVIDDQGLADLSKMFASFADLAGRPAELLEPAAEAFVRDPLALPRPRSRINAAGRTHMVDCFASSRESDGVVIGWGVPYGPYVEHGQHPHKGMKAQPHFRPTWKKNQDKYVALVQREFK
jgi:hypothetical protein